MIPLKRYCFKCTRQPLTSVQRSLDNKLSYQSLLRLMSINLFFFKAMAKNCSALPLHFTLVSCGPSNSSRDQCLGWGCCWNSSLVAENATQCYGIQNNQTSRNSTHTTSVPMPTTKNPSTRETLRTTAG